MIALQRLAGNRAVARLISQGARPGRVLMRFPRTAERAPNPRTVVLKVTPPRVMSGREFAIFVLQQMYGESAEAAAERLERWDAGGARWGKFQTGITQADVDTTIEVGVTPPRPMEWEVQDRQLHEQDMAAMRGGERRRINDETDRRFWQKVGDASHGKLGTGRSQQGLRELWIETREEVMRERDQIMGLPPMALEFVEPGGEELDPANYQAAVRIAEKARNFTAADWARYERGAIGTTTDYSIAEESVGRFAAKLASEKAIADRVNGTGWIFDIWHRPRASIPRDYVDKQVQIFLSANRGSFKSMDEYDAACDDYLRIFRERALEIAFLALRTSETVVRAELARYRDPEGIKSTYADLKGMRDLVQEALEQRAALDDPTTVDVDEANIERQLNLDMEDERKRLTRQHPIFADTELATKKLSKQDPDKLASILQGDAEDRLHDIEKTRARLVRDPEAVFQLDNVIQAARKEMGADQWPDIHEQIVTNHLTKIKQDHALRSIALTVLAIGLGLLTFGTGTVAVVAATALLAQGVYMGVEEVKAYGDAYSAAHTAFDSSQALSSDSPSAFWAAFALISAGLDGVNLVNALKAASTPLRILEETGSLKKFDASLLSDLEGLPEDLKAALTPAAKSVLRRAMKARVKLDELTRQVWRALEKSQALGTASESAKLAAAVSRCGYFGAQLGMKTFDEFVAFLKAGHLRGLDLSKLSGEELATLKSAWEAGVARAEAKGVAIKPTSAREEGTEPTTETEPVIEELVLGYATKEEVREAVKKDLLKVRGNMPERWDLVKAALRQGGGDANLELLGLIDSYMAALRDPDKWAEVIADAWEIAATMPKPEMRGAILKLAERSGLGQPLELPEVLVGDAFFEQYVITGRPLVDTPFKGKLHGELTHVLQDLVIDRALGAGSSAKFRRLLGQAEGYVERWIPGKPGVASMFGAHRGPEANVTFLEREGEVRMRTGDYVWRFTYDLLYNQPKLRRMPQPESIGPKLLSLFGLE